MAITAIMATGILAVFLNVITANKSAAYYSSAYKIADSMIEGYRSQEFDNIQNETVVIPELPQGEANLVVSNEIDGNFEDDIKELELTISWNFKRGQEIKIVTYVAREGL